MESSSSKGKNLGSGLTSLALPFHICLFSLFPKKRASPAKRCCSQQTKIASASGAGWLQRQAINQWHVSLSIYRATWQGQRTIAAQPNASSPPGACCTGVLPTPRRAQNLKKKKAVLEVSQPPECLIIQGFFPRFSTRVVWGSPSGWLAGTPSGLRLLANAWDVCRKASPASTSHGQHATGRFGWTSAHFCSCFQASSPRSVAVPHFSPSTSPCCTHLALRSCYPWFRFGAFS